MKNLAFLIMMSLIVLSGNLFAAIINVPAGNDLSGFSELTSHGDELRLE